jgi:acyl-coenzyme A thioesterase PaaI-like protein
MSAFDEEARVRKDDRPAAGARLSLQDRYAPHSRCFGCGPANDRGLHLKSHVGEDGDELVADWTPERHHEAFDGVLSGAVIGALFDCHSTWTAAWGLMTRAGHDAPPCTVTADFHVHFAWPTPSGTPLRLRAWVVESDDSRAVVEAILESGGMTTASCRGTFVAVQEGHPAYHG